MVAIEKLVCYSELPGGGDALYICGHTGKHQGRPGSRGARGQHGQEPYCGFLGEKQTRQGQQAQDWLVCVFQRPQGVGVVPGCLVPGPGVIIARE